VQGSRREKEARQHISILIPRQLFLSLPFSSSDADEGQALAQRLGCKFVESSAKTCVNVEKAYYTVVSDRRAPAAKIFKQG
jgi:hypothetical protein